MKQFKPFRSASLKAKLISTSLVLATLVAVPMAVHAGFFPGRPTFDYNKYDANNQNCDDPNNIATQNGRCGSMNGPVFDSFINTPSYGDERYFTDGRRTDEPASATSDTIKNVTDGSKQVIIRMYVHNNANSGTNCFPVHLKTDGTCSQIDQGAKGVAHNAKVSLELPTTSGSALQAVGAISASNATPAEVTDTVYLTAGRAFHVQYVPGSAKLMRGTNSYALSDSIVSGGALVGNTQMDGNLPGCFEYAALVEVKVNIIPEASTNLQLVKQVKNVGDTTDWHKTVTSKPGQQEQFLLTTKNIGLDTLTNAQVRDILPPHLALVPGSVKIVNTDQQSFAQADAPLFGNGLGLGTYPSGGGRYVLFKTTALNDFTECSIRVRNVAKAKSTETPNEVQDSADVVIQKENCTPPPPTPSYSCDLLQVTPGDNLTATFTASASANGGATISTYHFDFGDNTPVLVTDKSTVTHTYAKPGNYVSRVTVTVNVNGTTANAQGEKCVALVNFTTKPPTTTPGSTTNTTTSATVLPNTGPGSIAALFAITTIAGSFAHRRFASRRLNG